MHFWLATWLALVCGASVPADNPASPPPAALPVSGQPAEAALARFHDRCSSHLRFEDDDDDDDPSDDDAIRVREEKLQRITLRCPVSVSPASLEHCIQYLPEPHFERSLLYRLLNLRN